MSAGHGVVRVVRVSVPQGEVARDEQHLAVSLHARQASRQRATVHPKSRWAMTLRESLSRDRECLDF